MKNKIDRRRSIERLLMMAGAPALRAVDYDKPPPGADKLTAEQSSGFVLFRWNNKPLATYRAHSSQKYPYFYPLSGPGLGTKLVPGLTRRADVQVRRSQL